MDRLSIICGFVYRGANNGTDLKFRPLTRNRNRTQEQDTLWLKVTMGMIGAFLR